MEEVEEVILLLLLLLLTLRGSSSSNSSLLIPLPIPTSIVPLLPVQIKSSTKCVGHTILLYFYLYQTVFIIIILHKFYTFILFEQVLVLGLGIL